MPVHFSNTGLRTATRALASLFVENLASPVIAFHPEKNVGFGSGVNGGLAALAGLVPPPSWAMVSNLDLSVHPGASKGRTPMLTSLLVTSLRATSAQDSVARLGRRHEG